MRQRPFSGKKITRRKLRKAGPQPGRRKQPSAAQSVLVILEGGLLEAICAEPAVEALCRQLGNVSLTVASECADVYVGHPGIHAIMYLEADKQPAGFDRMLTVPTGPAEATAAERTAYAAAALGVSLERMRPIIHLTSLDAIRAQRFRPGACASRPVIALCLRQDAGPRWASLCRTLEERWNTEFVLVSGAADGLHVHHDLAGQLMPREAAAALTRCAMWLGDDPTYAALAGAVGVPGVFISDRADAKDDAEMSVCPAGASDQDIIETLGRLRPDPKPLNISQ